VIKGEGIATEKHDGTACMIENGRFYKRYDRKISKTAKKRGAPFGRQDFKEAPDGWIACEEYPDEKTGHWPGWLPISNSDPQDQYHREAFTNWCEALGGHPVDGTYELVGPKIQNNPYHFESHELIEHGYHKLYNCPRDYKGLKEYLSQHVIEGIVWHHQDGRMVKIKRKDFGYIWPVFS